MHAICGLTCKMNLVKMSRNNVVAAMVIRFILNSNKLAAYSKCNFERFLFFIHAFSIDKIGKCCHNNFQCKLLQIVALCNQSNPIKITTVNGCKYFLYCIKPTNSLFNNFVFIPIGKV